MAAPFAFLKAVGLGTSRRHRYDEYVRNVRDDFADFSDNVWLNCAHQGPLPLVAARAAERAIDWKKHPYELTPERFSDTPALLRQALSKLINADPDDMTLANSASYGLHLIARNVRWRDGDEVLVMEGDFPSDILPWLLLEARGVTVRRVRPKGRVFDPDELAAVLGPRTRLVCLTWVHSFSGWAIDLEAVGSACREHGAIFVVNGSQAIGARPLDVRAMPVDAVISVGFKWLCGPYGTGFCWISRELREALEPPKAYWLSLFTASDLAGNPEIKLGDRRDGRTMDVFGTANFFNFVPWRASIEFLLELGIPEIAAHDQALVLRLIEHLDREKYQLLSPETGPARSTLVLFSHRNPEKNAELVRTLQENRIHVAMRAGAVRASPHLHNTQADIDRLLAVTNHI